MRTRQNSRFLQANLYHNPPKHGNFGTGKADWPPRRGMAPAVTWDAPCLAVVTKTVHGPANQANKAGAFGYVAAILSHCHWR
ncbi:MAG: hypothetical protein AB7O62_10090 [Pirellulales bacterium]